jgi:NIMA (never in mitosis gene a)-related kinase
MLTNINSSSDKLANKFINIGNRVNEFEFLNELGRGSYGIVYKVKSKIDNNIYVIKKLNLTHMNEKSQQESWKEALILKKLNHKHIITYHTSFLEENNLYIVMEYAQGGDLYSVILL